MGNIESTIQKIKNLSWTQLREMVTKEMDTIPVEEHIVFEWIFQTRWAEFQEMILSLAEKNYKEIADVHDRLAMLGDFSQSDVVVLTLLTLLNHQKHRSPKLEYYLIGRCLHTRPRGKVSKIRDVVQRLGLA